MSFTLEGQGGVIAQVDATHRALRASIVPFDHGTKGHFVASAVSGSIAATLAANSPLVSFRWGDSSSYCILYAVEITVAVNGTITTGVAMPFEIVQLTGFTASDSGGNSITPVKCATAMGATALTDLRIASTGTLAAGTRTIGGGFGQISCHSGTTAGAQPSPLSRGPLYRHDTLMGHPMVFAQDQGFIIRNQLTGPATGTFVIGVNIMWVETSTFDATQRG